MPRLFAPLGIAPGIWENCPHGINCGGWGLYLTTEDIAKFAQLLLQNGRWHDRQLLPADYLAEAVSKQADNSANTLPDWQVGYGYQFWRSRHGYRGDGAAGQYAVMLPESDVAIAVTSCTGNMQIILDAIKAGYRHLDTARMYQNEKMIGNAIKNEMKIDNLLPLSQIRLITIKDATGTVFTVSKYGRKKISSIGNLPAATERIIAQNNARKKPPTM